MSVGNTTEGISQTQLDHVRALILKDISTGKTMLVDTGFDEGGEELVETLERECDGISRVIITHGDHGHHGGLPSVTETFNPELVTSANELKLHEAIDYEPDVTSTDGNLLDENIRVIEVSGHTKATSALLPKDRSILTSGDALDGVDRAGLPTGYLLLPSTPLNDNHKAAEINPYDLLQYDFEALPVFHGSHVFEDPKGRLNDFLVEYEWGPRSE